MSLERVKVLGTRLKWLTLTLIILTPMVIVALLIVEGPFALTPVSRKIQMFPEMLTWHRGSIVILISLLTPACYLLGYYYIYKLFDLYSKGQVFETANILLIRKAGWILIAIDIVYMIQKIISGPVFSLLGVTERHITIELRFSMLVVGIFVVLVSRVMEMGRELYKQDQLTI